MHLKKIDNHWFILGNDQGKFTIIDGRIGNSEMTVTEFKSAIREFAIGKTHSISLPEGSRGKNMDIFDHDTGSGTSKLNGEFHLLDSPLRYGPDSGVIVLRINPTGAVDPNGNPLTFEQVRAVVLRAVDSWNNVPHSRTTFEVSEQAYNQNRSAENGISTVTFEGSGILGSSNGAAWVFHGSGIISEVDLVFHAANRWNSVTTYPGSYPTYNHPNHGIIGPVDLEDVVAHEVGHGVGLHHVGNNYTSYTMHATNYETTAWWEKTWRRSLELGDSAGKIYQVPNFSSAVTQSNPKILLSAAPTTVFYENFTVPSGYSFEVEFGKTLSLAQNVSILSYGVLNLNGATIQKSGANSWDDLTLSGSGVSGSTITGSTITGSENGVRLINASGVTITSSEIQNHDNNGLYAYGSGGIQIGSTNFSLNSGAGILSDVSSIYFHPSNSFSGNDGSGIVADGASSMTFGTVDEEANVTASANSVNGVHAMAYSYIELGGPAGGSTYGGWNTIRPNILYNAQAQNNSYIEAQYTYWGPSGLIAGTISADGSSSVDYSNWLSHPAFKVVPGTEFQKAIPDQISSEQRAPVIRQLRKEIAREEFDEAWWLDHHDEEMRQAARIVLLSDALQSSNYDKTVSLAQSVLQNSRSAHEQELAHRTLFLVDLMEGDYRSAATYLNFIPEQGPGNHRQNLAALLPKDMDLFERDPLVTDLQNTEVSIANYPNPFNPTTVIGYQLPVSSVVQLSVYDLLGREVSLLVNGEMSAGTHQATFDGRNLASGIYLYRLQVNGQVLTGKMLLTK